MKIGFQGWFLKSPYTGIGQHSIGLLRELAKMKGIECLVPTPAPTKIKGVPSRWLHTIKPRWWIPHRALKRWYWEAVQVPQFFQKQNPDWEYYPYPCPIPRYSPNLRAVTVHDLILWEDPRYKGNRLKSLYHKKARAAVAHTDHVFTVSKTTKKRLGLPTATVLYNGTPTHPKKLPKSPYPNALVYLGGYDIRKNVPALVHAFDSTQKSHPKIPLVLIGNAPHKSKYYPDVPKTDGLIHAGTLSDAKVYALLKEAFAFVHFSDDEGFNIPLLQAMSVGCPAIIKDIPVNREVAGDAAFFLKPKRKGELLATMKKLSKKSTRESAKKKSLARAKDFSWKKSARELVKTLKAK